MAVSLALLVLASGWLAALPPYGSAEAGDTVTVVLRPDVRPGAFLAALGDSDVRIVANDGAGRVWILKTYGSESRFRFYQQGAAYVSGSILPAGCSRWLRV